MDELEHILLREWLWQHAAPQAQRVQLEQFLNHPEVLRWRARWRAELAQYWQQYGRSSLDEHLDPLVWALESDQLSLANTDLQPLTWASDAPEWSLESDPSVTSAQHPTAPPPLNASASADPSVTSTQHPAAPPPLNASASADPSVTSTQHPAAPPPLNASASADPSVTSARHPTAPPPLNASASADPSVTSAQHPAAPPPLNASASADPSVTSKHPTAPPPLNASASAEHMSAPMPAISGGAEAIPPNPPPLTRPGSVRAGVAATAPELEVDVRLPNASVGKPYHGQLDIACTPPSVKLTVLHIDGLEALGLRFDPSSHSVSGQPQQAGEFTLTLRYQRHDTGVVGQAPLVLTINPDPRSLWKNLPSDPNCLFWKPDSAHSGLDLSDRRILAASMRGRSHALHGSCRDDDLQFLAHAGAGWSILAVADGAGSCRYSREGSRLAVTAACNALGEFLHSEHGLALDDAIHAWTGQDDESLKPVSDGLYRALIGAAQAAVHTIRRAAEQQQTHYRDFSTTLQLAAYRPLADGQQVVISYWVGDGALAVYESEHSVYLLGEGDSGEYAGQTRFLDPSVLADPIANMRRIRIRRLPQFRALCLLSDGVSDPRFETEHGLQQQARWNALWNELHPLLQQPASEAAAALEQWLNFWSPGHHDDRSLLLLLPTPYTAANED